MPHFANFSEENYLKTLYKLGQQQELKKLNNTALAAALELNPATVLEMVRKLVQRGLVVVGEDKAIELTEKGRKKALLTIRKHRLWEVFLVDKMRYTWNEVHDLAEQLEHVESPDLIDRLEAFLDYPAFDPHGDPIPDRNGRVRGNVSIPLSACPAGKSYLVVSLGDTSDDFLQYLGRLEIRPGLRLKLEELHPYDGSCTVSAKKKKLHLSEKVARNVLVRPSA